ncbi:hypothetical protein BACCAP_00013 [Pseudoflavonifractor capillosus ATCC 29799]|uniref:Uncharacterized protein n=1 Tax=Pseudoflavonifractor capillosus ATCC 29799 TaxID=411467 RepID=A6NPC2_9FIRM|nr:hypothetical protein BACCAP_00013 [Pseudoflavonifractor capillosus ATCC 29799]
MFLISIHAPRVGSDKEQMMEQMEELLDFNPRSPCGERPTQWAVRHTWQSGNFNPRSPCGERRSA